MDVALLIIVSSCIAQASGDRYGSGGYGAAPPAYTQPAAGSQPSGNPYGASPATAGSPMGGASASPQFMPPSQDPIFTAAAPKRTDLPANNTPAQNSAASPAARLGASNSPPANLPVTKSSQATSGQATSGQSNNPAKAAVAPAEKTAAGELLREALVLPQSLALEGRGTSLYESLGAVGDRRRQLEAVRAYWTLATAVAEFHFAWQQTQFLEHLQKVTANGGADASTTAAEVAARLAAARAHYREAEARLSEAQVTLAERAFLQASSRPLPLDPPHVGIYHTQYERVFSGRAVPARAQLLNRTLPMRKQIVDIRADGVFASQDAYEAAFDSYQKGRCPATEVLTTLDEFRQRRSEFIVAVRRYNEEIAEYALTSAPESVARETLVGMLIKNPTRPAGVIIGNVDPEFNVVPTSHVQTVPQFAPMPDPVSAEAMPTLAPSQVVVSGGAVSSSSGVVPASAMVPASAPVPRNQLPSISSGASSQPTAGSNLFPPPGGSSSPGLFSAPVDATPMTSQPSQVVAPYGAPTNAGGSNPLRGEPTLAPPQVRNDATDSGAGVPRYRANKIPLGLPGDNAAVFIDENVTQVGYTTLASLPPARRAQDLIESLYATQNAAADPARDASSPRVTLAECLAQVAPSEQQEIVAAYWSAAEQPARVVQWTTVIDRLEALGQATLRMPDSPAKTAAMLRVRSARLAAEAERMAARVTLEGGRMQLTQAVGRPLSEPWLATRTAPHGGGYKTKIEAMPASVSQSSQLQQLSQRIASLHETLQYRAEAVVQYDAASDGMFGQFNKQQVTAHMVVAAIFRQARETDALLAVTTRYNLAIADYAVRVLPNGTPRDALVGSLVVDRTAVASRGP